MLLMCCSSENDVKAETSKTDMGKTLVVYYSYTGNCREIANTLAQRAAVDMLEIAPVEEGLRYEANNYAIGSALISAIRDHPNDADSYPAIKPVEKSLTSYQNIIVVTPLWWSNMAAPMQSFLFQYGRQMADKRIGLIVSSHSSGISSVVADAKRLIPNGNFTGEALWINNGNRSRMASLLSEWLTTLNFTQDHTAMTQKINIVIDGKAREVTLVDNAATQELVARLQEASVTVTLSTNGDFEIWGPLGFSLPTSNEQITTHPGDVILYGGSNICIFYGSNAWSYTRIGRIDYSTLDELKAFLKAGEREISVTLSLAGTTAVHSTPALSISSDEYISLNGIHTKSPTRGVYIKNGRKIVK